MVVNHEVGLLSNGESEITFEPSVLGCDAWPSTAEGVRRFNFAELELVGCLSRGDNRAFDLSFGLLFHFSFPSNKGIRFSL